MLFFLYGMDSFRRARHLQELVAPYKAKYENLDLLSVDLEDEPESWVKARDFLNQPSMFVESKVAIVKNGTAIEEKEWVQTLKNQIEAPRNFVFVSQDNPPPPGKFDFLLQKPVKGQEFSELREGGLEQFIKGELLKQKLSFQPAAFRFFCSYIEGAEEKSALASAEIEKLGLMNLKEPVALADLQAVMPPRFREKVYILAREILENRDKKSRLKNLEKLLLEEEAAYVFNSLGFQAQGEAAEVLAKYDISVKSGGLEYEEALTDFVISN